MTTGAVAWTELELGVQISLQAGVFRPGDYWLIPARTFPADIEWPRTGATPPQPIPQPPVGVQHHYCRLALFDFAGGGRSKRGGRFTLFPPLTERNALFHVVGAGRGDGSYQHNAPPPNELR